MAKLRVAEEAVNVCVVARKDESRLLQDYLVAWQLRQVCDAVCELIARNMAAIFFVKDFECLE